MHACPCRQSTHSLTVFLVRTVTAGHEMMALDPQYSSHDAAGLQHLLLCKVLCGSQEIVRDGGAAGSSQFEPSCLDFDTGVDDFERPHRYLIWASKVSTHVLPLHVVSVRRS